MRRKILVVLIVLLAAPFAFAALTDSYGPSRVGKISISCPEDTTGLCVVTISRVRSLTAQAQTEATAAGISVGPIREEPLQRNVTRAVINAFLNSTTAIP